MPTTEQASSGTKKPTNLSVNQELLAEAKSLKINLSATFEAALEQEVKARKRESWLQENRKAIEAMNAFTEKHGLFSDKYRPF